MDGILPWELLSVCGIRCHPHHVKGITWFGAGRKGTVRQARAMPRAPKKANFGQLALTASLARGKFTPAPGWTYCSTSVWPNMEGLGNLCKRHHDGDGLLHLLHDRQREREREGETGEGADYISALCTHCPSLLLTERSDE